MTTPWIILLALEAVLMIAALGALAMTHRPDPTFLKYDL